MPQSQNRRLAYVSAARSAGRRWRSYLALVGITATVLTAIALVPATPLRHGYAGLVLSAVGAMIVIGLIGMNNPALDGRFGAQWSVEGLRTVRGWHVTDHLTFEREDVDHVVVAPSAVLAVETKYHARACPAGPAETERDDLDAAERAAHNIRIFLRSEKQRDAAVVVVPVLAVSGPGAPPLPNGHRIDNDVHVVDGTHPELWMHLFNVPRLDPSTRREMHACFEKLAATHAEHSATVLPPLRQQLWRELRGGIAQERAQRAARQRQVRSPRRRHGFHLVPVPGATTVPAIAPIALGTTQATG